MKKILVGQFERVLGTATVDAHGQWVLTPQDGSHDELSASVERVFARVQRRQRGLTRVQFLQQFFTRDAAPTKAYTSSVWAKAWIAPHVSTLIDQLLPANDHYLRQLHNHDQYVVAQFHERQRA